MAKKRVTHSVDAVEIEQNAKGKPQYIFANTHNQLMEEKGIDQEKMAVDLGISVGAIHNYRHGKTEPKLSAIIEIANYLDIDCHYLLTGVKCKNHTLSKDIGLSDKNIDFLSALCSECGSNSCQIDALNGLIGNIDILELLYLISEFKRTRERNEQNISDSRCIVEEVKQGLKNGVPADILLQRICIPIDRLLDIEKEERYLRFSIIDSFTKLFDNAYKMTDFSISESLFHDSVHLKDELTEIYFFQNTHKK